MHDSPDAEELSFEQVVERLAQQTLLPVNVLPLDAFSARRIPGSLHLPLSTLQDEAPRRLPDKSRQVLVYCTGFG